MSDEETVYILKIGYRLTTTINLVPTYINGITDQVFEYRFDHRPSLEEIKGVMPDTDDTVFWIRLEEQVRSVKVESTEVLDGR